MWRKGVHWEKSGGSDEYGPFREGLLRVEDNVVVDSGLETPTRRYDGAFTLVSSMNAHYRRNIAQGSRVADFLYRQDGRLSGEKHGWRAENVIAYADNDFHTTKGCDIPARSASERPEPRRPSSQRRRMGRPGRRGHRRARPPYGDAAWAHRMVRVPAKALLTVSGAAAMAVDQARMALRH